MIAQSVSSAGSLAFHLATQAPVSSSVVRKVALTALAALSASMSTMPAIFPIAACVVIGTIIALSLFLSAQDSHTCISIEQPRVYYRDPLPIVMPRVTHRPYYHNLRPFTPPVSFMQPRYSSFRQDCVGERSGFSYPRPSAPPLSSFRRDRVGERSGF